MLFCLQFVASFSALLAPSTHGWEKEKGTADALLIEDGDAVGATPLQVSVGSLRLRASLPEVATAVQCAADLVARALASPRQPGHWRVDSDSADVKSRLTRLFGGRALLEALGFAPEADGRFFSLREQKAGAPTWSSLPAGKVEHLKRSLLQREAQRRGLDHPEVADVAAVSAAVALLRDGQGRAGPWEKCVEAVLQVVEALLKEEAAAGSERRPADPRFRTLPTDGGALAKKLAAVDGGVDLLVALGFREAPGGGALHLPRGFDPRLLRARLVELKAGLAWLSRQRHQETGRKPPQETAPSATLLPAPAAKPAAAAGAGPSEARAASTNAATGKSREALLFEQKKRREAEAALADAEREASLLRRKLAVREATEITSLSVKDTVTLMRMDPKERSTVGRMAKALGVTSALLDHEPLGAEPGQESAPAAPKRSSKSAATNVKTVLDVDAAAGATRVSVKSMAGFVVGHKLRVGTGAAAEERLITGFGSLVLAEPLARPHAAGSPVVMLRPSPDETKRFRTWQLRDFVRRSILEPMVAVASAEGQRVVNARRSQVVFARRPVEKHVFSLAVASAKQLPGAPVADRDPGAGAACLAALPTLGQVLVASPAAPFGVTVAREGVAMARLRRFFDAADLAGSGALAAADIESALHDARGRHLLGQDAPAAAPGLLADIRAALGEGRAGEPTLDWGAFVALFRPDAGPPKEANAAASFSLLAGSAAWDLGGLERDTGVEESELAEIVAAFRAAAASEPDQAATLSVPAAALASAELDGEPVAQAEVDDFLATSAAPRPKGGSSTPGPPRLTLRDFVMLRQSRVPRGGHRGCGGWRRTARAALLALFRDLASPISGGPEAGQCANPYKGDYSVDRAAFVARAQRDYALGPLFGCMPDPSGSLLEAIQRLGTASISIGPRGLPMVPTLSGGHGGDPLGGDPYADGEHVGGGGARLGWDAIESCVYPAHLDRLAPPLGRPLSYITCAKDLARADAAPGDEAAAPPAAARVYETAVDQRTGQLFVLLDDGELQVWDATSSVRMVAEQVILPQRPGTAGAELQKEHTAWRVGFKLDRDLAVGSRTMARHRRPQALALAKAAASRLLALRPRLQVLSLCAASSVLALNTTAGDQSFAFLEPLALRRLVRVRLALAPMKHFDPCLFQQYPDAFPPSPSETSLGAVERFAYLAAHELLVATLAGSDQGHVFCAATGTRLAALVGHRAPLSALLWAPRPEYALTGCEDGSMRVWDLGASILPEVATAWVPYRQERGLAATRAARPGDPSDDTATLEAALVGAAAGPGEEVEGGGSRGARAGARVRALLQRALEVAGMRPSWRAATVSSLLDLGRRGEEPLVEITFDDGSVSLGTPPLLLRHPDEAAADWTQSGPDLSGVPPVQPKVGARVAVWHTDQVRTSTTYLAAVCGVLLRVRQMWHIDSCCGDQVACSRRLFGRFDTTGGALVDAPSLKRALAEISNDVDAANADSRPPSEASTLHQGTSLPPESVVGQGISTEDAEHVCRALADAQGRITYRAFENFLWGGKPTSGVAAAAARLSGADTNGFGGAPPVWAPRVVATKWVMSGHRGAVTAINFLSASMLIVSTSRDGVVRLWDPTSHPHRLVHPGDTRHRRVHPGFYKRQADEWTATGRPYVCVHELSLSAVTLPGQAQGKPPPGRTAVALLASGLDAAAARSQVVLAKLAAAEARALDAKLAGQADLPVCRGFLYLLDDGELIAVPSQSFEPVFVTLSDAAFFEVTGLVSLSSDDAFALRRVFYARHRVLRVLYVSSFQFASLEALRATLKTTGAAADRRVELRAFVNAELVIFGHADDGPEHSVRAALQAPATAATAATATAKAGGRGGERYVRGMVTAVHGDGTVEVAFDHATATARVPSGRVEVTDRVVGHEPSLGPAVGLLPGMRCRIRAYLPPPLQAAAVAADRLPAGDGGGPKAGKGGEQEAWDGAEVLHMVVAEPSGHRHLVTFRVGRVTVLVPAKDFDEALGPAVEASAATLLEEHFDRSLTRFRALLPGRLRGIHRRNVAEASVLADLASSLRSAMLTRHQRGNAGAKVEAKKLTIRAFEVALRLPLERSFASDLVAAQLFYLRLLFAGLQVAR